MLLPDGTVLMHDGAPYDPVKAHEYYLRTRKLKGRRSGTTSQPSGRRPTYTVQGSNGKAVRLTEQQLMEQRAYAAYRVNQIKKKLHVLAADLRDRLEAARKREAEAKKPPTAAEKAKAAREAKQYRDKHQQELANKRKQAAAKSGGSSASKPKAETVESIKKEIIQTKANLKDAVARQRNLATAKKNG